MKLLVLAACFFTFSWASAQDKMKFNFPNDDLTKVIETYVKATNTKVIVDSTVRGNVTILNPGDITQEEALNQLAEALALNGFSMNKRDDYYIIRNGRSAQRDALEISTSLPSLKPQRMATWIVTLKNVPAAEMQTSIMKIALGSYGEMVYNRKSNQLMISDYTSSLHRVNSMLLEFDRTEDPRMNKLAEESRKVEEKIRLEEKIKAAAPKNEDGNEKLSEMEIKIKKKPESKPAAAATSDTKPTPEAAGKKDN